MNRMKKTVCFVLAVLMVVAMIPTFVFTAMAQDNTPPADVVYPYLIYQQGFDGLDGDLTSLELASALGWFVPDSKSHKAMPKYSVVDGALRVDTRGLSGDSFINILSGDVMSIVRGGNFTLSYKLTYLPDSTNHDGFASVIYNYNELDGKGLGDLSESYGIVAVRPCGSGFNGIVTDGATISLVEKVPNSGEYVMGNRYSEKGDYDSLYETLFKEGEDADTILSGGDKMEGKTLSIKMVYQYNEGVYVYINDILVSKPNTTDNYGKTNNTGLWSDFLTGSNASTVALLTAKDIVADIDDIEITADLSSDFGADELPELLITEIAPTPNDSWAEYLEIYNPTDKPIDFSKYSILVSNDPDGNPVGTTGIRQFEKLVNLGDLILASSSRTLAYKTNDELAAMYGNTLYTFADKSKYTKNNNAETYRKDDYGIYNKVYIYSAVTTTPVYRTEADLLKMAGLFVYADDVKYDYKDDVATENNTDGAYRKVFYIDGLKSSTTFYKTEAELKTLVGLFVYVDDMTYYRDDKKDKTTNPEGACRKIRFVNPWNNQYSADATLDGDYMASTFLNPGETLLIHTLNDSSEGCWWQPKSSGEKDITFSSTDKMYTLYAGYGLTADTKVLVINQFNLVDAANINYYLAKTEDEAGDPIEYKNKPVTDPTCSKYVVSFINYCPAIVSGNKYEGSNPTDGQFGQGANRQGGYSAVYVYGVDASADPRQGTLYCTHNTIKAATSHVGDLATSQMILLRDMYRSELPELMITELVPRTANTLGEEKNAFSAMEITNTGDRALNLYDYALVRNGLDAGASRHASFRFVNVLRPGCPVERTNGNGPYYFFTKNTISNPETCQVQPGESVVIWFITSDTYTSYANDASFGFDYFRQYWADNGSPQMAMKNSENQYATKVVAVDANTSTQSNYDFASVVFDISTKGAALYGIAYNTPSVRNQQIFTPDMVSVAYFSPITSNYKLTAQAIYNPANQLTYYANVQNRTTMPINASVRYVVGLTGNRCCSAMVASAKVKYYRYDGSGAWNSTDPEKGVKIKLVTTNGTMQARLGTLDGIELKAVYDQHFVANQNDKTFAVNTYRENASGEKTLICNMFTLKGASVSTTLTGTGNGVLRFDNAMYASEYLNFKAVYGDAFRVGMLIVKSADLQGMTKITEKALQDAGIAYEKVAGSFLYRDGDFAVIGSSLEVASADWGTSYTAIGYVEAEIEGDIVTSMSNTTTTSSVEAVATAALADIKFAMDDIYCYSTRYYGEYSRYTEAEQEVLRDYTR